MTGIVDIFMGFHGDIMYNQLVFHCSTGKKNRPDPKTAMIERVTEDEAHRQGKP